MTTEAASPAKMQPVRIGPDRPLPDPKHTLANAVIGWAEGYQDARGVWLDPPHILQPDGPEAKTPWRFTAEQVRFLMYWYEIDDNGRFVYRNGVFRRMKGAGKNPFSAAIMIVEFVGPCRFGGWLASGEPLVVPQDSSWVQAAAVSKDQTRNTMTLLPAMLAPLTIQEHGVELGKELIYAHNASCRIEAVTSSPRALEGGRPTHINRDETHHWIHSNGGHAMAEVIDRNTAKSRDGAARVMDTTNAHDPGEDSVAQRAYDAYVAMIKKESRVTGILYDSIEAPAEVQMDNPDSLREGLICARGDSVWLDVDRLIGDIMDPRTPPSMSRRYYLNQIQAAEDAWVAPHEWDVNGDPALLLLDGDEVTLGLDGSKTDDHTVLAACRVSDGAVFPLGMWEPENFPGKEIPRVEVDRKVADAMKRYLVDAFFSDVKEFESYVDKWEAEYGDDMLAKSTAHHSIAFDMRGRLRESTQASEAFHDAIMERVMPHPQDRRFSQYIYNARRRPNQYGVTFGKESRESPHKVDGLAAAMLARLARQTYLALPDNKKRRRRTGRALFV